MAARFKGMVALVALAAIFYGIVGTSPGTIPTNVIIYVTAALCIIIGIGLASASREQKQGQVKVGFVLIAASILTIVITALVT